MNKRFLIVGLLVILFLANINVIGMKNNISVEKNKNSLFSMSDINNDLGSDENIVIISYEEENFDAVLNLRSLTNVDIVDYINETEEVETDEGKCLRHVKLDSSMVRDLELFDSEINRYLNTEEFIAAEPNYFISSYYEPNDPYWDGIDENEDGEIDVCEYQWAPRAINCEEAWAITKGNSDIVVAVLDTGVTNDHKDFLNKNTIEYDIMHDDNRANDDDGHGTHCAGIVVANMDNNHGIAGIAPKTTLMAIKVLGPYGGTIWDGAKGIIYAAKHGAWIISMSFGGPSAIVEMLACRYAHNIKNVFLCAASGNDYNNFLGYPAGYPSVYSVGSVNRDLVKAPSSNGGLTLDFVAPGVDIISTYRKNGQFRCWSGTSMACPHVAGVAALYYAARDKKLKNPEEVYRAIKKGAKENDLGEKGKDMNYGWGLIDASITVKEAVRLRNIEDRITVKQGLLQRLFSFFPNFLIL
jgi:subtilisin family serine protease